MDLKEQGFRYILRDGSFKWEHPALLRDDDMDCTDMDDDEFEAVVREHWIEPE